MEYRRSLAASFLFRFLVSVNNSLAADVPAFTSAFPDDAGARLAPPAVAYLPSASPCDERPAPPPPRQQCPKPRA